MTRYLDPFFLAVFALLVVVVAVFVRQTRWLVPLSAALRYLRTGQYARARVYAERAALRARLAPEKNRRACALCLAACDFEEGNLGSAIERLRASAARNDLLGDAAEAMIGASMLLADVDPGAARRRLETIVGRRPFANVVLLLAHALLSEGDLEAARAMFATADNANAPIHFGWGAYVRYDSFERRAHSEAFLRGWFLLRTGEPERAKPLLAQAEQCSIPNQFSIRAAQLRAALG
jgi:tetratricopeptide (TPR) repeat protein